MTTISIPFDQYKSETLSSLPIQPTFFEMRMIPSVHETHSDRPKLITPTKDKYHPVSTVIFIDHFELIFVRIFLLIQTSSFKKSFISSDNLDISIDLSRTKSLNKYQEQQLKQKDRQYTNAVFKERSRQPTENTEVNEINHKNRRYGSCKICSLCSYCCCLASLIGILLFLSGIAALLVFILTNKHITTTITTTTSTSKFCHDETDIHLFNYVLGATTSTTTSSTSSEYFFIITMYNQ